MPPAESVHWLFATGFLVLGLCQLGEALVGSAVWQRRRWRAYVWPATAFGMGLFMWPVMVFFTSSTLHMLAHGVWAQVMMLAGAAELGLVRGKLKDPRWALTVALGFFISGVAMLVHEQNPWFFSRAAFLHHALGWTAIAGSLFPLARAFRPGWAPLRGGYAATMIAVAVLLYCDRSLAPIFGHLSQLAR